MFGYQALGFGSGNDAHIFSVAFRIDAVMM